MSRETFINSVRRSRLKGDSKNVWRRPDNPRPARLKYRKPPAIDESRAELSAALNGSRSHSAERPVSLPKITIREIKWDAE